MSEVLISKSQIHKRNTELGKQIATDFKGKNPLFIGVLAGSFIFLADLTREVYKSGLKTFDVDFVRCSSYAGKRSTKLPEISVKPKTAIKGRNIIIVEDIVDTGYTLEYLMKFFKKHKPKSIKTATLLSKPSKHEVDIELDYIGFSIENVWVEGYGMDTDESGRSNPNIIKK